MPRMLYLIDGHAQFFRAYHAIRTGMSSPVTSEPTNLTFGFTSMLLKLLREYRPDYLAVVIDAAGDRETFRSELYEAYKANREPPPDDFHPQVERCLEILEALDIPVLAVEGVEADDVLATIARRLTDEPDDGLRIRIVSKDKDLTQLISDRVELFDLHKDEPVTPETIFKTQGVQPRHVRDILALMGDAIDNVPGVPGIGPKTAAKLILEYGSIEAVYAHLDEIKGKRHDNLKASRAVVELSRKLVTLRDTCEVAFDLDSSVFDPAAVDVTRVKAVFRELGFNRLQDEVAALAAGGRGATGSETNESVASTLFDSGDDIASAPDDRGDYRIIRTRAELEGLVKKIRGQGTFTFDTETTGLQTRLADLCGISISLESHTGAYIPVRSPDPESHLATGEVIDALRPVFEDSSIEKTGQNLKFDINVLRTCGVHVRGVLFDTMVASYVIDATRSSHSLNALALSLLDHTCLSLRDLIGSGRKQKRFDEVPLDLAVPYAAEDADITLRLRALLEPRMNEMGLRALVDDLEMPLVAVLAELEWNGIRVDPDELDRQRERLVEHIDRLRGEIINSAPHAFNPDSPKQLAAALFNKPEQEPPGLGLRPLKRGKTGPSTDVEVLEKLAADPEIATPVPRLVVKYRQLTKLVNTYLVALKDAINPRTGRVHASFHQTVAATGRLSSSDPNLQNIPIRTEVGREIRRAFVAEPGHVLITADYSQIELRILAHLSKDLALIEAFHQDADIHTTVAAEVYGVVPEDVTPAQRSSAKMINFGIVYGVTPFGLARRLGPDVRVEDAREIIANYKARFSGINEFLDQCIHEAETKGYVETILKRRRAIPQIHARHQQQRSLGERMAINTVVQGSAADLIKVAMIDLYRTLPREFPDAKMLLQIHDELVLEAPRESAEAVRGYLVDRMEHAMSLTVPLKVDSAIAESWIDAK